LPWIVNHEAVARPTHILENGGLGRRSFWRLRPEKYKRDNGEDENEKQRNHGKVKATSVHE
jgi:hypothetical protein